MTPRILITAIVCVIQISCVSSGLSGSSTDINLLVPGKSAEGYNIDDPIQINDETKLILVEGEIRDIINIEALNNLSFDSILYKQESVILFIKNKTIIAIAGLKSERRITSDAVKLSAGTGNFVQNYGTSGLETYSINNHKVHVYKTSGIAVFDDNNDDIINMYLVFKK